MKITMKESLIKVNIDEVAFDESKQMGVVLLADINLEKVLPIWIGLFEAQAANMPMPRKKQVLRLYIIRSSKNICLIKCIINI